ncbi:aminoglycoside phosphotransferase family protein [Streptomyces sp. NPDC052496]|uniref:aminoglycoside phosphotransferase family protein n=1 Tax=Streptomyces sp. NPDC052496 TaxID=3154951 RepID=UPI00344A377F
MPTVPNTIGAWARRRVGGEIAEIRDVTRRRAGSRVWELTRADAARFFLKVAPAPDRYTRETHAYRHAVPALGHAHAPVLVDSDPGRLALLLTAAPGAGASAVALGRADRTELYRQAGGLLRRLHDACRAVGPAGGADQWAAGRYAAAEQHVAELSAAGVLDAAERRFVLDRAAVLHLLPPLPPGFLHGDIGEHHFLWDAAGRRLALTGFAQARLGCAAEDLVRVAHGACLRDPVLRAAFLRGYGRDLTEAERYALPALAALDAAETWARGVRTDDGEAVERARGVVGALVKGVGLRV